MTDIRYITNSELTLARRCLRKWYLTQYRRLYRPAEHINENAEIGNLCHFALAEMYNSDGKQDPIAAVLWMASELVAKQESYRPGASDGTITVIEDNIDKISKAQSFATIIVTGYVEWLEQEGEDSFLEFVSAEQEVTLPFPADGLPKVGVHLLAKLDARFIDKRTGARVFMDHKTVQNFTDKVKMAHLDPQFLFYSLVEYLLLVEQGEQVGEGTWTDGGILNMLKRVKRTTRSKPPFYMRHHVRHSIIELQNYFKRVAGEITRIQQVEMALDAGMDHHLIVPPNATKDCTWDCPFMSLCAFMDDGSDVEMYIVAAFEVGDPLRRYETVTG